MRSSGQGAGGQSYIVVWSVGQPYIVIWPGGQHYIVVWPDLYCGWPALDYSQSYVVAIILTIL